MWTRPQYLFSLLCIALLIWAAIEGILWHRRSLYISQKNTEPVNQSAVEHNNDNSAKPIDSSKISAVQQRQLIMQRQLFGTPATSISLSQEQNMSKLNAANIEFILMGTIELDSKGSRAIIKEKKSQEQKLYKQGDTIEDAVIKEILRHKVILTINRENKILEMGEPVVDTEIINHSLPSSTKDNPKIRQTPVHNILKK